jgi:hypothetical protein
MAEVHALDLAHEEMQNGRLLWEYANEFPGNTSPSTENTTNGENNFLSGK